MSYFSNMRDIVLRTIAFRYLRSHSKENLRSYPRMAILSFDYIGHEISIMGRYERAELDLLARLLERRNHRTAIDIGANIGNHTIFFAELFDCVHAFEPNPRILPLLHYNTDERANVHVHPFGASSRNTVLNALIPEENEGGAHVATETSATNAIPFEVRRLDDVAEVRDADDVDFVKLDIEGHELEAIEGMADLLARCGPVVALEQNADQVRNGSTAALDCLRKLGYSWLYEISSGSSKIPQSLPKPLRTPLRVLEVGFRDTIAGARLVPLSGLESRSYTMLVLSKEPLEL